MAFIPDSFVFRSITPARSAPNAPQATKKSSLFLLTLRFNHSEHRQNSSHRGGPREERLTAFSCLHANIYTYICMHNVSFIVPSDHSPDHPLPHPLTTPFHLIQLTIPPPSPHLPSWTVSARIVGGHRVWRGAWRTAKNGVTAAGGIVIVSVRVPWAARADGWHGVLRDGTRVYAAAFPLVVTPPSLPRHNLL